MNTFINERIYRILTGIACGDAMGKITSKYSEKEIHKIYGGPIKNIVTPIRLRSERKWRIGDVTDDTILTLLIADSLINNGCFIRRDVARRLIECDPRGGKQIYKLKSSRDLDYMANDGLTNGAAIRVSSLSVTYLSPELEDHVVSLSTLTHGTKDAVLATLLVSHVFNQIAMGMNKEDILYKIEEDANELSNRYLPNCSELITKSLRKKLNFLGLVENKELCDIFESNNGFSKFSYDSVPTAIILGLVYKYPRELILDVINRKNFGWDLDSVASIATGICNSLNNHSDCIDDWIKIISKANNIDFVRYSSELSKISKLR